MIFSQSTGTVFLKSTFVEMIRLVGDTKVAQIILDGEFQYRNLVTEFIIVVMDKLKKILRQYPSVVAQNYSLEKSIG